jgi:hypothetical protein
VTRRATAPIRAEVGLLAGLSHAHLVQVLDAGEHDGAAYFGLERIEACSLLGLGRASRVFDAPPIPGVRRQNRCSTVTLCR